MRWDLDKDKRIKSVMTLNEKYESLSRIKTKPFSTRVPNINCNQEAIDILKEVVRRSDLQRFKDVVSNDDLDEVIHTYNIYLKYGAISESRKRKMNYIRSLVEIKQ